MSGSDIVSGAAVLAGAAFPPLGAALGIANALGLGSLVDHMLGHNGTAVAGKVMDVARAALGGVDPSPEGVAALPPDQRAAVMVQMAQIAAEQRAADQAAEQAERQAELDLLSSRLKDVADARAQTVALAQAGSNVQWAPAAVSFVVLVTFGVVMWAALTRALPTGSETILNMLLGTLAAMATSVVAYWVGSSAGSAQKTQMLYRSTPSAP